MPLFYGVESVLFLAFYWAFPTPGIHSEKGSVNSTLMLFAIGMTAMVVVSFFFLNTVVFVFFITIIPKVKGQ
jgi:hypothetical protein